MHFVGPVKTGRDAAAVSCLTKLLIHGGGATYWLGRSLHCGPTTSSIEVQIEARMSLEKVSQTPEI